MEWYSNLYCGNCGQMGWSWTRIFNPVSPGLKPETKEHVREILQRGCKHCGAIWDDAEIDKALDNTEIGDSYNLQHTRIDKTITYYYTDDMLDEYKDRGYIKRRKK